MDNILKIDRKNCSTENFNNSQRLDGSGISIGLDSNRLSYFENLDYGKRF